MNQKNGKNSLGDMVTYGDYSYSISAYDANESSVSSAPLISGIIEKLNRFIQIARGNRIFEFQPNFSYVLT